MKYYNYQVTFSEIPDEVTLCINITGCPIHCEACHSKFLWEDVGIELTKDELYRILNENKGISCVCIMGGDAHYNDLRIIFNLIRVWTVINKKYLKLALYSGRFDIQDLVWRAGAWIGNLNYVKVGSYIESLGGLNSKTTNQKLYMMSTHGDQLAIIDNAYNNKISIRGFDITYKFWK